MTQPTQSEVLLQAQQALSDTLHYLRTGDGPARVLALEVRNALYALENKVWEAEHAKA